MDIVPQEQRDSVTSRFVSRVKGLSDDPMQGSEGYYKSGEPHIDCGVIGISWLMRYLSKAGLGQVAYQIASTKTYPGWGYMAENGATTIWELWNGNTANPSMNSGNHVMKPQRRNSLKGQQAHSPGRRPGGMDVGKFALKGQKPICRIVAFALSGRLLPRAMPWAMSFLAFQAVFAELAEL